MVTGMCREALVPSVSRHTENQSTRSCFGRIPWKPGQQVVFKIGSRLRAVCQNSDTLAESRNAEPVDRYEQFDTVRRPVPFTTSVPVVMVKLKGCPLAALVDTCTLI